MEILAEKIVNNLIKRRYINENEAELCKFGVEAVLFNSATIIVLFFVSVILFAWVPFVVYLCFFVPLRTFGGGYHANTPASCVVLTIIIYLAYVWGNVLAISINENPLSGLIIVLITGFLSHLTPVMHINNIVPREVYCKNKTRTRVMLVVIVVFYFITKNTITSTGISAALLEILFLDLLLVVWAIMRSKRNRDKICVNS